MDSIQHTYDEKNHRLILGDSEQDYINEYNPGIWGRVGIFIAKLFNRIFEVPLQSPTDTKKDKIIYISSSDARKYLQTHPRFFINPSETISKEVLKEGICEAVIQRQQFHKIATQLVQNNSEIVGTYNDFSAFFRTIENSLPTDQRVGLQIFRIQCMQKLSEKCASLHEEDFYNSLKPKSELRLTQEEFISIFTADEEIITLLKKSSMQPAIAKFLHNIRMQSTTKKEEHASTKLLLIPKQSPIEVADELPSIGSVENESASNTGLINNDPSDEKIIASDDDSDSVEDTFHSTQQQFFLFYLLYLLFPNIKTDESSIAKLLNDTTFVSDLQQILNSGNSAEQTLNEIQKKVIEALPDASYTPTKSDIIQQALKSTSTKDFSETIQHIACQSILEKTTIDPATIHEIYQKACTGLKNGTIGTAEYTHALRVFFDRTFVSTIEGDYKEQFLVHIMQELAKKNNDPIVIKLFLMAYPEYFPGIFTALTESSSLSSQAKPDNIFLYHSKLIKAFGFEKDQEALFLSFLAHITRYQSGYHKKLLSDYIIQNLIEPYIPIVQKRAEKINQALHSRTIKSGRKKLIGNFKDIFPSALTHLYLTFASHHPKCPYAKNIRTIFAHEIEDFFEPAEVIKSAKILAKYLQEKNHSYISCSKRDLCTLLEGKEADDTIYNALLTLKNDSVDSIAFYPSQINDFLQNFAKKIADIFPAQTKEALDYILKTPYFFNKKLPIKVTKKAIEEYCQCSLDKKTIEKIKAYLQKDGTYLLSYQSLCLLILEIYPWEKSIREKASIIKDFSINPLHFIKEPIHDSLQTLGADDFKQAAYRCISHIIPFAFSLPTDTLVKRLQAVLDKISNSQKSQEVDNFSIVLFALTGSKTQ